ncbi:MAG: CDP-2,3-bis-(O-geranylgeranyl)-sn-glycerol synthase [Methanothrix sp.]|nr:CDP-2,3-bis-(O-geranylgeranyl)-sn-glycerol synthase [Methanothrix sp.]MDD4447447.1 CDP-2,3-bis-(O-geranylgeranyl)-sn-glycerol synthase [Methanothrix sp.]
MDVLITAFWLMLPAYLPNNCAVLFGGGTALDFGMTFHDGNRMLGDGKTFRGTMAGTLGGIIIGLLLNHLAPNLGLPSFGLGFGQLPVLVGLSFGAMLGDIVAAFFKRRMGLKRGAQLFIIDQLDFVVGSWALTMILAPEWFWQNFTSSLMIVVIIITPILHRVMNIIGYHMGSKREPW